MIDISTSGHVKMRFIPPWKRWYDYAYVKRENDLYFVGLKTGEIMNPIDYKNTEDLDSMTQASKRLGLTLNELSIYIDCAKCVLAVTENSKKYFREKYEEELNECYKKIESLEEHLKREDVNGYKKQERESYVYLFYNEITELTKIGKANDPKKRKRTLSSYEGKIKTIRLFKFKTEEKAYCFERKLHAVYDKKREHGEWFRLGKIDIDAIESAYSLEV